SRSARAARRRSVGCPASGRSSRRRRPSAELRRRRRRSGVSQQILFIQGGGEGTHDEWDDKLVDSLTRELGPDFELRYPRMPHEGDPSAEGWVPAIRKEIAALDRGAIVVGHSVG